MSSEINIKNAILHILDSNLHLPVLSSKLLEINDDIELFLMKQIHKVIKGGDLQKAVFSSSSKILCCCSELREDSDKFISITKNITSHLFDIMQKNIDIPSSDLILCSFNCPDLGSSDFLGIFKLNYKEGYSHFINQTNEGIYNTIIKQKAMLPTENQKIEEFAIIDLESFQLRLVQKEYEINGEKVAYWSTIFLQCQSELSHNSKIKILDKAARTITEKYPDKDFNQVASFKTALIEHLEDSDVINVEKLARKAFDNDEVLADEYVREVQKQGVRDKTIQINNDSVPKKITNHKIKTDTGIEINFPSTYFNDTNKIEFITNIDGTISILMKNILKIDNM